MARILENPSENGAYLGLPLIGILMLAGWQLRRDRHIRAVLIVLALSAVASLGPMLKLDGRATGLTLPWQAAMHLPLIHAALPSRFTLYVALAASLVAAVWIGRSSARTRPPRIAAGVLAAAVLWPNPAQFAWVAVPQAPSLKAASARGLQGSAPNVLVLPFGSAGPSMAWQLDAGMSFTQAGGYAGFWPRAASRWAALHDFVAQSPPPDFRNDLIVFCLAHQVGTIFLAPDTPAPLRQAILALGWPVTRRPDLIAIRVPPRGALDYLSVTGDYWPSPAPRNWMGRKVTIVTGAKPAALVMSSADRPQELGTVAMTVTIDHLPTVYRQRPDTSTAIVLPPDSTTTIEASSSFVPAQVLHNGDPRHLSVTITVTSSSPRPAPAR